MEVDGPNANFFQREAIHYGGISTVMEADHPQRRPK